MEDRLMDLLDRMTTMVRVVDAGSLSKAARQMRLSTAAVSRQLSALEAQLGTQLLVRTTRHVTTTGAGRAYYQDAVRILAAIDEAHAALPDSRTVRGLLRVSVPVAFGLARICPLLPQFLRKHPGLKIDLRLEDRPVNLARDGMDLAIVMSGGDAPDDGQPKGENGGGPRRATGDGAVALRLGRYGRYAVASPAYLRGRAIPDAPGTLTQHEALMQSTGDGPDRNWHFTKDGRETRVTVNGPLFTNVVFALRDAALLGLGVALLPEWLVQDQIDAGRLCRLLPDWSANEIAVSVRYRQELRGVARLRAFIDWLRSSWPPDRESPS